MFPKIGLVFDGGGGKGAYQIGVWKAMCEMGIDKNVTAVSGASVGGLNACLFVQGDYEKAENIWNKEIEIIKKVGIEKAIKEMLNDKNIIDFSVLGNSKIECFIATYCIFDSNKSIPSRVSDLDGIDKISSGKMTYFNLRSINERERKENLSKQILLATSALPVFCKSQTIDGKKYIDGGIGDNSPIYPLCWNSTLCDTIIVIHLDTLKYRIDKKSFPGVRILEIVPNVSSDELGFIKGTLNFDLQHVKRLIQSGYNDSIELFFKMKKINDMSEQFRERNGMLKKIEDANNEYILEIERQIIGRNLF